MYRNTYISHTQHLLTCITHVYTFIYMYVYIGTIYIQPYILQETANGGMAELQLQIIIKT